MDKLNVFIGWDSKVSEVSEVCAYSLIKRASIPINVTFLKLTQLQQEGLYSRASDPLASTEFTYSRFLTPYLSSYNGLSLYCDNDFLWLEDIAKLIESCDISIPLHCVKHVHIPTEKQKMDGKVQTCYPRKNWSSLMLFNCEHPKNKQLDIATVNKQSASYLHQLKWLSDIEIGSLSPQWNWLEGYSPKPGRCEPKAIHFTRGGPWLHEYRKCDYADIWIKEQKEYRLSK